MEKMELYHVHVKKNHDYAWKENKEILIPEDFKSKMMKRYNDFSTSFDVDNYGKIPFDQYIKNYLENIIYSNNIDKYELLLLLGKAHDIIYYSNMFKRETAMDNFRKDNCNKLPSRLHSIYLTDEKSLDNWIDKLTRNGYEQVYNDSYNYWHPNFKKVDDKSNEYLVQGKVKVLEKINHTKK